MRYEGEKLRVKGGGVKDHGVRGEGWWMRELGWGRRDKRLSVKEEERGGGSELGSDLDLDPVPWKTLWIRFWQNNADPLDPDPQHWGRKSRDTLPENSLDSDPDSGSSGSWSELRFFGWIQIQLITNSKRCIKAMYSFEKRPQRPQFSNMSLFGPIHFLSVLKQINVCGNEKKCSQIDVKPQNNVMY